MQKGFSTLIMVLGMSAVTLVAFGVYFFGKTSQEPLKTNVSEQQMMQTTQQPTTAPQATTSEMVNAQNSAQSSNTPSSSIKPVQKAELLSTSDWQTVTAKNFSIKAPANLLPFVSDPYLIIIRQQKEYIAEKPQYSVAQVGIPEMGDHNNLYNGSSRRQWYLDYYCKYKDEPCPYTFQEKLFGNVNGLEVYRPSEYRYGVSPESPIIRDSILVAVGTKLFVFNGSFEYSKVIDASISTLKVN